MAGLVTGEVEADHALVDEPAGDLRERHVLRGRHVPQRRDDDPALETEGFAPSGPAAQDGAYHVGQRKTLLHMQPWTVTNLGITHLVALQVFAELVGGPLQRRHVL